MQDEAFEPMVGKKAAGDSTQVATPRPKARHVEPAGKVGRTQLRPHVTNPSIDRVRLNATFTRRNQDQRRGLCLLPTDITGDDTFEVRAHCIARIPKPAPLHAATLATVLRRTVFLSGEMFRRNRAGRSTLK